MTRVWTQRIAIVAIWITAIVAWRNYQTSNDLGTVETAQRFIDQLDSMWWGPLAYVAAYLARPLLLFPASVMTIAGGLLFGPVAGVLIVVVAANASAMLVYVIGRSLAGRTVEDGPMGGSNDARVGLIARWGDRMRARSFETVFVMRLLFLPYDVVNVASGALRIRWTSFLAATVLGTIPGTISFVLLGASLERIDEGLGGINPWTVIASVAIFLLSLAIARVARTRTAADLAPARPDISRNGT
jgi:uncharacterized membrane protein YdjX (TVP38/TMEM64 family)